MCTEGFRDNSERVDVFAPTPAPVSVRGLLLDAAWFDLRVETADSSCEMFARPPQHKQGEGTSRTSPLFMSV